MLRSAAFLVQRYMLGRHTLLARARDFDLELRVPARDAAGARLYRDGMHAPAVADLLATRLDLRPGELVFDIGASVGWYSLVLSRTAPRGTTIHAFEPDPWARGLLQENISRNRADAVTVIGAAVGEHSGVATLHRYGSRRRNRNGLLRFNRADTLQVEILSLDEYCRRKGLSKQAVGLVKVGVQGFEFQALTGARQTLARCRAVLTEYAPRHLEQADVHPASMLDLLVEHGFSPAVVEAGGLREVERPELIAAQKACTLYWRRPGARVAVLRADPDGLAI